MTTVKHFEELWVEAEEMAMKMPNDRQELFIKVRTDIEEYQKLDKIPSNEIKRTLKTKKLGEILYKIAELSRMDNINTYAALQLEMQHNKAD